ncbi:MAG TPA: acyclic terpene utilization AtuA family protein [Fervidobacterium sp.]|nr:acyclic terpene utilization AtuA family protein [Fervidobacterium sp.]
MKELKILSPCGILGYGYPRNSFENGLKRKPDLIAVDAGSTDAGPHKLGAGVGIVSRQATKKDLEPMLIAGYEMQIPVIIGSAGGAGAKPHVEWTMDIIKEIVSDKGLNFKTAVIYADVDKSHVREKIAKNEIKPLGPAPELTKEALDQTNNIVGQMGHEPIVMALENGAQLIVAGRAYDPSVFAAYPIYKGFDSGLAYHLGKILECGALCAEPGTTKDCIMGYLRDDHFLVEPLNEKRKCYTTSVAAHTLYEKDHPYHLLGPGSELDLSGCTFEQFKEGIVKVSGSKYLKSERYTIKLEGAAQIAYRTLVIAGIRDPIMISNIEEIKGEVIEQVSDYFYEIPNDQYKILFHLYGKNGVMGPLEPETEVSHELGIVIEVVAVTQELANTICAAVRSTLMHFPYKGRKATAGNLAFLYSPSDIPFGPVYKFTIYHLDFVADPCELFSTKFVDL